MPVGTFSILDQIRSSQQSYAIVDRDTAWQALAMATAAHNRLMRDMRSLLMVDSTDRQRKSGSAATLNFLELEEHGTPPAQKVTAGANMGFPLRRYGAALQFTRVARKKMTMGEFAAQAQALLDADYSLVISETKKALYRPTNYTFTDRLVDFVDLSVKRLANADSFPIVPGPNAESFTASSHNHYLVSTSTGAFVAADADALVLTVREHHGEGNGSLYVSSADGTRISLMAKFRAVQDARIIQANSATYVNPQFAVLDTVNTNNRLIGLYDGIEVWVKPWAIDGYPLCVWAGPGVEKPLVFRTDPDYDNGNMMTTFQGETHSLEAMVWEHTFGIGVGNRVAAAVMDTVNGTYTAPV